MPELTTTGGWTPGGYRALDFRFTISAPSLPRLAVLISQAFMSLATGGDACEGSAKYTVSPGEASGPSLHVDGELVGECRDELFLMDLLMWHVNQRAIAAAAPTSLVLHAAAVTRNGMTIALPAASGSGKSTLVAALVRRGWSYVTDEALAIDLESWRARPYPKPISLGYDSFPLLSLARPADGERLVKRQVAGSTFGPVATDDVPSPQLLVFLSRPSPADADEQPAVLPGSHGVVEAARCAFHFRQHPRRTLDTICQLLQGARSYRVPVRDIETTILTIESLCDTVDTVPAGAAR